eukprot:g3209.t1
MSNKSFDGTRVPTNGVVELKPMFVRKCIDALLAKIDAEVRKEEEGTKGGRALSGKETRMTHLASIRVQTYLLPIDIARLAVADPKQSHWRKRSLMTSGVVEEKRQKGSGLTALIVPSDQADDTADYWIDSLSRLLAHPSAPTTVHTAEMKEILDVLRTKMPVTKYATRIVSIASRDFSGLGSPSPMEREAEERACLEAKTKQRTWKKSPNRRLFTFLVMSLMKRVLAEQASSKSKTASKTSSDDVSTAVASISGSGIDRFLSNVQSLVMLIRMWNGVGIDELDETAKMKDKVKLNRSFPGALRRIFARSLARMSFLQLYGAFSADCSGILKSNFRSIHIARLALDLSKREASEFWTRGAKRVFLIQALLRKTRYPKSPKEFESSRWSAWIREPLRDFLRADKLFEWPQKVDSDQKLWIDATEWCEALAGKKIPRPYMNTPGNLLARLGNTSRTWTRLIENGQMTPKQLLLNFRSVLYAGLDADLVRGVIARESSRAAFRPVDLLKSEGIVPSDEEVREIVAKVREAASISQIKLDKKMREKKLAAKKVEEVSLVLGKTFVKDKKGNVTELEKKRSVSVNFGPSLVKSYREMFGSLLETSLDKACATDDEVPVDIDSVRSSNVALISYTTALARNSIRVGQPPLLPRFCKGEDEVMWTGECRSLYHADRKSGLGSKVLAGISWCECERGTPGDVGRIDLDLSLLLFDDTWSFLDHCSYQKLRTHGCTHSGDLTSAPYPKGARETVEIDIPMLRNGFPKCRYVAIVVYSFSGQSLDTLPDASVFIADPTKSGSGPGNCQVIAANRMSGVGGVKFCGYLSIEAGLEPRDPTHLVYFNANQSLNSQARSATMSAKLIKTTLERMVDSEAQSPNVKFAKIAAMLAAYTSDTVVISAARPPATTTTTDDKDTAMDVDFTSMNGGGASSSKLPNVVEGSVALRRAEKIVVRREQKEPFFSFFNRVRRTMGELSPCENQTYDLPKTVSEKKRTLCVFGSVRRDNLEEVVRCSKPSFSNTTCFVDLGGRVRKEEGERIVLPAARGSLLCFGQMTEASPLVHAMKELSEEE